MRYILRRHELTVDEWRAPEDASEASADAPLIVPLAALRADPGRWQGRGSRLGVRLAPVDGVEELAAYLPALSLVAVEFPNPGDGRGYSQARLLRERLGFRGELRAVGAGVRQDQLFLMARCGFDAFELAAGVDPEAARRAFERYDVAYQSGSSLLELRRQRFPRPGSSHSPQSNS
jgi:uncharacterized protein (DUF934 family)